MKAIAVLALFGLVGIAQAATDAEIQKAEKDWAKAVMAQDASALGQILADELIYAHSTGNIDTKAKYLSNMKSGAAKYELIEHQDLTVKAYGDTGVAHSHVRMKGTNKEGPFDNKLMMLHVWVKQGGKWHLVAHQTTKMP